ncbi:hypothetical protein [Aeromicrobium sp.]
MHTKFVGPHPWHAITKGARTKGPRHAAIAFLAVEAPELVPLTRGDLLVVNAGDVALGAHATSPVALRAFIDKGVDVRSDSHLHAKVLATSSVAVIGSANASTASPRISEAAVVTSDPKLIEDVTKFVESLAAGRNAIEVDDVFLKRAERIWQQGTPTKLAGVTAAPEDPDTTAGRVHVHLSSPSEYSVYESEYGKVRRSARQKAGPAANYKLGELFGVGRSDWSEGDIVYHVHEIEGEQYVWPAAEVVSADALTAKHRLTRAQILAVPTNAEPLPVDAASAKLRSLGCRPGILQESHEVKTRAEREALAKLW